MNYAEAVRNFQGGKAFAPPFFEGFLGLPPYIQGKKFSATDERTYPVVRFDGQGNSWPGTPPGSLFGGGFGFPVSQSKVLGGINHGFIDRPIAAGVPPSPIEFRIQNGREKPAEHSICTLATGSFTTAAPQDFSDVAVPLTASCYVQRTDKSQAAFMFAPRVDGVVAAGGVYFGLRQVYGPHRSSVPIDYTVPFLPENFCVFETGRYISGNRTPSRSRIVPGTNVTVRAGLGRENIYEANGTRFSATAYCEQYALCSLAFDFVPADEDATIVGWAQEFVRFLSIGRGLPGQWPLAFWLKIPDRGEISNIAFFGGACAYPAWQGSASPHYFVPFVAPRERYPQRAEWGSWQHSKYPYTLRGCADGLRPEGKLIESIGADSQPKTPIYAEFKYTTEGPLGPSQQLPQSEIYPVREVQAKCAELETTPRWSHFDPKTAFLYDQCDDFIFDGKKITKLNVTFAPYLATQTDVPTGSFTPLTPPTVGLETWDALGLTIGGAAIDDSRFSTDRRFGSFYWKANGSVPVPPGEGNVGRIVSSGTGAPKNTSFFYSGTFSILSSFVDGGAITSSLPAGPVSEEVEKTALLSLERSVLYVPVEPNSDPAFTGSAFSSYKGAPSSIAPPTGAYDLEPFSLGGISSAPGVFHYVGSGDFSASQTFTINRLCFYGGPSEWQLLPGSQTLYVVKQTAPSSATIATTLDVSLYTDHIEIYSVLGSRMQEAGAYQIDNPQTPETEPPALDVWDDPRGRLRDQVIYIEGLEPHALLTLTMFVRTAMRGEASASADYSSIPGYGGSFATPGDMFPYSTSVVGTASDGEFGFINGSGNLADGTVIGRHHNYVRIDYTFTRSQTLALLNGEAVELTAWQTGGTGPFLADLGVQFFQYRMVVTATVEEV